METQADNITVEVPSEALKAMYNATVHYQAHILSIPPCERGGELEQDFDIIVGLSEAFDHVLVERAVRDGAGDIMRGIKEMLGGNS